MNPYKQMPGLNTLFCDSLEGKFLRVAFFHDHFFGVAEDGQVYSRGTFPASIWKRYLKHVETISVVGRKLEERIDPAALSLSSTQGVSFVFATNMSSIVGLLSRRIAAARLCMAVIADADAVIARLPSELGLLALGIARKARKPCAVEIVGCPWDAYWNFGGLKAKIYAPLAQYRMRSAVWGADAAIYVTKRFLQGRYPASGLTGVASNVMISAPGSDVLERRIRRASEVKVGPTILGTIGSLTSRYKGVQTIIDAVATIRDIPVQYRILGPGDPVQFRKQAENLGIGDRVFFDGVLPSGVSVLNWLDSLDIYLQPSLTEGLPRATIEAMSRGLPIIGSTAGGIPELLSAGVLHAPGDHIAAARILRRLIINADEALALSRTNFGAAGEYFVENLDAQRDKFWGAFVTLCSERLVSADKKPL